MRLRAWSSVLSICSRSAAFAGAAILWRIAAAALASVTAASSRDWQMAHQDKRLQLPRDAALMAELAERPAALP